MAALARRGRPSDLGPRLPGRTPLRRLGPERAREARAARGRTSPAARRGPLGRRARALPLGRGAAPGRGGDGARSAPGLAARRPARARVPRRRAPRDRLRGLRAADAGRTAHRVGRERGDRGDRSVPGREDGLPRPRNPRSAPRHAARRPGPRPGDRRRSRTLTRSATRRTTTAARRTPTTTGSSCSIATRAGSST